jgi:hypothetical protein
MTEPTGPAPEVPGLAAQKKSLASVLGSIKDILTNIYGIVTVVAAIAASFAGGAAVGRATAPADAAPAVTSPAATHPAPTPSAVPSTTIPPRTAPATTAPPTTQGTPDSVVDLSTLEPLSTHGARNYLAGPVQIGTTPYPESVRFTCLNGDQTEVVYNVAGYHFLDATIGVPNDATNGAGNTTVISFLKNGSTTQLGKPVTDVVGLEKKIHLDLQGSAQLEIACTATQNSTHYGAEMDITLGGATLTP